MNEEHSGAGRGRQGEYLYPYLSFISMKMDIEIIHALLAAENKSFI